MKLKFKLPMDYLATKLKNLVPYTTKQEKNMLLLEDETLLQEYIDVLTNKTVQSLNEAEAIAILYKLRMISVTDLLEGVIPCPHCKTVNDFRIELNDVLQLEHPEIDKRIPLGLFSSVEDILDDDVLDEMSVKEYKEVKESIENNNKIIINTEVSQPCWKCRKEIEIAPQPVQILSKSSTSSIFQEIFNLGYYMHNGINDIYNMLPYERELYHKLLAKELEKRPNVGL